MPRRAIRDAAASLVTIEADVDGIASGRAARSAFGSRFRLLLPPP
jgi:hypothetical protein